MQVTHSLVQLSGDELLQAIEAKRRGLNMVDAVLMAECAAEGGQWLFTFNNGRLSKTQYVDSPGLREAIASQENLPACLPASHALAGRPTRQAEASAQAGNQTRPKGKKPADSSSA